MYPKVAPTVAALLLLLYYSLLASLNLHSPPPPAQLRQRRAQVVRLDEDYCGVPDAFVPTDGAGGGEGVTLVTQGSVQLVGELVRQSERWEGPVSAALVLPAVDEIVLVALSHIHRHIPHMRTWMSIHVLWHSPGPCSDVVEWGTNSRLPEECGGAGIDGCIGWLRRSGRGLTTQQHPYPINIARNFARNNVSDCLH